MRPAEVFSIIQLSNSRIITALYFSHNCLTCDKPIPRFFPFITYNYRYNKDGIRYRKYLENGVVLYQLDGSVIVGEQKQNNGGTLEYNLEFCYDSNDQTFL